ncbi:unnamed protein product [Brassicogethes aeneus]|uniref:Uncharacterized protein n=1 Tax=Brassicogethes aeneus TaxID=1431903 RepID=A0A9P0FEZ4_BRAAE|nr:unnamed protein product [Brassicogethes aeneus]
MVRPPDQNTKFFLCGCVISRFGDVNWPARSCDLTPLDYFLWGFDRCYADNPETISALNHNIETVIGKIGGEIIEKVLQNWTRRIAYCRGSHMNEIDKLLPNSSWKDYSSNTNYAFDALEENEEKHNGKQAHKTNVPNQTYIANTRSLQRPKGNYSYDLEKNTFSLPRTYDKNKLHDIQPDFYFMPSQRKYSGEVVRVDKARWRAMAIRTSHLAELSRSFSAHLTGPYVLNDPSLSTTFTGDW